MKSWICGFALLGLLVAAAHAQNASNFGQPAPDFPPGLFSDGNQYRLEDYRGKVVILFFFEQSCPTCRATVPKFNEIVDRYKGKPVIFLAVNPGASLTEAQAYNRETNLAMPIFADRFRMMEALYGEHISLDNIYQFKIIGVDGRVNGFVPDPALIEDQLKSAHWKYKDDGYDPQLAQAVDLLEWNQYEPAARLLRPALKAYNKPLATSAQKLYAKLKEQGAAWQTDAQAKTDADPVAAFDLYTRLSAVFTGDDMGKAADSALKKLRTNKAVRDELAARAMYDQVPGAMGKATPQQKGQIVQYCQSIAAQYPATPTGKKAKALAAALDGTP